ncbi:serine hydrolase domain-containing protein [Butyrivibrio sp. AE3009]|uniref:serine hydrolase domain-containing protein n=1 Tax=Butyrivibrio sp. AE3009 TaxID=1280666 RepID=UPI0003B5BD2C|nr:serine hydrolase domain-containing protein [Butyrivibrio sp. AE3009]
MFSFDRCRPEEVGVPSQAILNTLKRLDKKDVPMHSFLVLRKDRLIFEGYYAPYRADTLHRMFSISKSFTALSIFLLIDEGKVSLSDSIVKFFPEYTNEKTHPWIKQTTIENMLMMRTCHASTTYKVDMKSDWVESFFTVPPTHKPGTVFHYDTSAAHVLCALVEKLTGTDLLSFLKEKMLKFVDFSDNSYMVKDPFGVSIGGSGLMATPMDVLKVLYILDKKGTITCSDGKVRTLISPALIEKATSNLSDTLMTGPLPSESMGYGMQIWQNEKGGFVLYGMGGQLGISIPDKNLLIMTTADTQGMQGGNQLIYDAIYEELLPNIQDTPIESGACPELEEYKKNLAIGLPRLPISNTAVTGREYYGQRKYELLGEGSIFAELLLDIKTTGESRMTLTEKDSDTKHIISFGLDRMCTGTFSRYNTDYTAGALFTRDNVLCIRVHLIGECVGSLRFQLYFEDGEITVFMRKIEETYFGEYNGHLYGKLI